MNTDRNRLFAMGQVYVDEFNSTLKASNMARLHKMRGGVEAATLMHCIAHGVTDYNQLINTATRICGSSNRMVWNILLENRGDDPERHLWYEEGTLAYARKFVLHKEATLLKAAQ